MSTDDNQNTSNQLDNNLDTIQEIFGTLSSLAIPKPVAETIDAVNILIDVKQEQNSSPEIPTWKITVANLVGASASAPVFSVGEGTSIAAALANLSVGGPAGLVGSAAILYNGSVMTAQLGNETYR
jgi:hypothetical protein